MYERLFLIASGGMAEVWVGRRRGEEGFQRLVALKYMLPSLVDDEHFVEMFTDEAHLASNIASPHVVHTHDLRRDDAGGLYLVMDLVVGSTLASLYRSATQQKKRLPDSFLVEVAAQTALGLDDAHRAKTVTGKDLEMVHRDVSPQNIMVGLDGYARMTDFGVATALHRRTRSQTGELKGKYRYFSPEQCLGEGVDARSDIFALGIVLWETVVGRRLFMGSNPVEIMDSVMHRPIPMVTEIRPSVSSELADVIARALQRDSAERFQTARAMSHALRAIGSRPERDDLTRVVSEFGGPELDALRTQLQAVEDPETRGVNIDRVRRPSSAGDAKPTPRRAPPAFFPWVIVVALLLAAALWWATRASP
ncbi:MAG: serine/threonine-protein kinase [Polyangiales bacterium]